MTETVVAARDIVSFAVTAAIGYHCSVSTSGNRSSTISSVDWIFSCRRIRCNRTDWTDTEGSNH